MRRLGQWLTTGIGTWGYPPGVAGIAIRTIVVLTLIKATLAVIVGIGLLVYLISRAI